MQVTLFKALKSINVDDDRSTMVVERLEEHLENMIRDATKNLEAKIDSTNAKIDAMRSQITFIGIMLSVIGLAIAAGPIVAKFIH